MTKRPASEAMDRIRKEMRGRTGKGVLSPLLTITVAHGGGDESEEKPKGDDALSAAVAKGLASKKA